MADQFTQPVGPFDCDIEELRDRAANLSGLYFIERVLHNLLVRIEKLEAICASKSTSEEIPCD
jgi:hypothetical protein